MTDNTEQLAFAIKKPSRAHTIILKAGGDTRAALAQELHDLADLLERGELSTGCSGSPSSGSTYQYCNRPEQTHDKYFADIEVYLTKTKAIRELEV